MSFADRFKRFFEEKFLLKNWSALPSGGFEAVNPRYCLTWDVLGIRSKKSVLCPVCECVMIVRNTHLDWSEELGNLNPHIDLRLKCPSCDLWLSFGVAVPKDYFMFVFWLRKRSGIGRAYAPVEGWLDEELIKDRLKALGYW